MQAKCRVSMHREWVLQGVEKQPFELSFNFTGEGGKTGREVKEGEWEGEGREGRGGEGGEGGNERRREGGRRLKAH